MSPDVPHNFWVLFSSCEQLLLRVYGWRALKVSHVGRTETYGKNMLQLLML